MKNTTYTVECQEYDGASWYRYDSFDTLAAAEATMNKKVRETANVYAARVIETTLTKVEIRKEVKQKPIDPKRLKELLVRDPVFTDGSEYIWRLSYMDYANKVFKLIRCGGDMVAAFGDTYLDGDWLVVNDGAANTRRFLVYMKQKFTE